MSVLTAPPSAPPWLSIIGIGEDGRDGLSLAARTLLSQATLVVGGTRHLALAGPIAAETMTWSSPLADGIAKILARRGEAVCILASGDPFFYGVGSLLAAAVPPTEFVCLPAASSFSLAAARLGWALQDCRLLSLHGRKFKRLIPYLQPRAKVIALTWDATTPGLVAEQLCELGCGGARVHVLEALGGGRERHRVATAEAFDLPEIDPLNIVAVDIADDRDHRLLPIAPGLPDDWFENDGQITKHPVRAMTLAALQPHRGGHLWDIGAGSGSVSIEWMLLDPANRATAIECHPDRAARILCNAERCGVPDLALVEGRAPEILAGLPMPDAIFIGGGASDGALVAAAWSALAPGGRLVINAVTIETQARLIDLYREKGGDLFNISLSQADPVGRFHGWRPAMPITQWAVSKPWEGTS